MRQVTLLLVLLASSPISAKRTSTCDKITKPDKKQIQHKDVLDNEVWHCVELGPDAKTTRMTYLCVHKVDGIKVMVTPVL